MFFVHLGSADFSIHFSGDDKIKIREIIWWYNKKNCSSYFYIFALTNFLTSFQLVISISVSNSEKYRILTWVCFQTHCSNILFPWAFIVACE